ncbi:hypothetical protein AB0K18_44165 [Nonomuraea sp. NPDC049421]|uniref:hypothetical protein n=1 Tax=Nonomuraea sp. NPDC049421 TaxID=3155275 RepID=UPI003418538C
MDLIEGRRPREEIASWAACTMLALEDVQFSDEMAWDFLMAMTGVDIRTAPETYLYDDDDFRSWLAELA